MQTPRSFEWQDVGGIAVVHFTTTILRDDDVILALFEQLDGIVADGNDRVILSFAGIDAIASIAIGKLVRFHDRLQAAGGRLALCELTPIVAEIVDIMHLRKRLHVYPTEQAALESFA